MFGVVIVLMLPTIPTPPFALALHLKPSPVCSPHPYPFRHVTEDIVGAGRAEQMYAAPEGR